MLASTVLRRARQDIIENGLWCKQTLFKKRGRKITACSLGAIAAVRHGLNGKFDKIPDIFEIRLEGQLIVGSRVIDFFEEYDSDDPAVRFLAEAIVELYPKLAEWNHWDVMLASEDNMDIVIEFNDRAATTKAMVVRAFELAETKARRAEDRERQRRSRARRRQGVAA